MSQPTIDTIILEQRYSRSLSPEVIQLFVWQTLYNPHNRSIRGYIHQGKKDSHLPRMTFMLRENGFWYLRVEVSLSKWLHNSNVNALSFAELLSGLERLSYYVSKISGIRFDAQTANVSRVDFVEDRCIAESKVIPFFKRTRDVSLQTMRRQTFEDTTVYFKPRSEDEYKVIRIYSKLHEVLDTKGSPEDIELARGKIRLEVMLRTRAIKPIIKKLKLSSREAHRVLTPEVAEYVLAIEKQRLNYDELFKAENDNLQVLLESTQVKNVFAIYGFLEVYRHLGKNFYKLPVSKCSKRTYQSYLSTCRKQGLLP